MAKRRKFTDQFKAKVALEALHQVGRIEFSETARRGQSATMERAKFTSRATLSW